MGGGNLVIESHRGFTSRYGNVGVRGTAVNEGDGEISYTQIEAKFYNARDTRIGSGMDNINGLGPGRTWEFECLYMGMDGDRVDSYKLEVL